MSEDCGKNIGGESNDFALIRKSSNGVEKVAPGAKYILSSMVADALALVPGRTGLETEGWVEMGTRYFSAANYTEAVKWYSKAAEHDHAKAQCFLGHCYAFGWGVKTDKVKAVHWFHKSAESGYADAQRWIGDFYRDKANHVEAVKWYRKAAEQGDFSCQSELGECYQEGKGVPKDDIEAVSWYRKAADQNFSTAQCDLGSCYRDGKGVAQDYHEAVKWYRLSAEGGWAKGQYNLGLCYATGRGIPQDYKQAMHWYHKAAEQGYSDAQESLGGCYANGKAAINVEDMVEIYQWVKLAEDKGYEGATKTIEVISGLLSSEELQDAKCRYQKLCSQRNWLYERLVQNFDED